MLKFCQNLTILLYWGISWISWIYKGKILNALSKMFWLFSQESLKSIKNYIEPINPVGVDSKVIKQLDRVGLIRLEKRAGIYGLLQKATNVLRWQT